MTATTGNTDAQMAAPQAAARDGADLSCGGLPAAACPHIEPNFRLNLSSAMRFETR